MPITSLVFVSFCGKYSLVTSLRSVQIFMLGIILLQLLIAFSSPFTTCALANISRSNFACLGIVFEGICGALTAFSISGTIGSGRPSINSSVQCCFWAFGCCSTAVMVGGGVARSVKQEIWVTSSACLVPKPFGLLMSVRRVMDVRLEILRTISLRIKWSNYSRFQLSSQTDLGTFIFTRELNEICEDLCYS